VLASFVCVRECVYVLEHVCLWVCGHVCACTLFVTHLLMVSCEHIKVAVLWWGVCFVWLYGCSVVFVWLLFGCLVVVFLVGCLAGSLFGCLVVWLFGCLVV